MAPVLRIEGLKKGYRTGRKSPRRDAVDGLDLLVEKGEILGLLGPNGAGKTTTLKSILGLVRPDAGEISVFGIKGITAQTRKRIGFLPEQPYFEMYLTPRKLLAYFARLFGLQPSAVQGRISHLLNLVGLDEEKDLSLNRFSKGMLQRMGIAQALIGDPEFLILDEPSTGLDPLGKIHIRSMLEELKTRGTTILLSSHQLSEIEDVCDSVAIIDKGREVGHGSLDELLRSKDEFEVILCEPLPDLPAVLSDSAALDPADPRRVTVRSGDLNRALKALLESDNPILEVKKKRLSLEEFFMSRLAASPGCEI
jgi:ABC-2 type transport system ATP-binding protein